MDYFEMTLKLLLSLATGFLIGWERERCNRAAGLKTHTLTSIGATVFAMVGMNFFLTYYQIYPGINPMYVVGAVATGIGFIGAGSIIRSEKGVQGLSAAASIWIIGATGLAIGFGYYYLAVAATLITFLVLAITDGIDKQKNKKC